MTVFAITQWSETVFAVLQKRPDTNGYNLAHPEAKFATFADAVSWVTALSDATIVVLDIPTKTERMSENGDSDGWCPCRACGGIGLRSMQRVF